MTPQSWPLVSGVLIEAPTAWWLVKLLDDGRRRARRDAWKLPKDVSDAIEALEALASTIVRNGPSTPEPTMTVKQAAELLEVSDRRVTQLLAEHKLRGHKRSGVWAVDTADVIMRLPSEPIGTPSEAA